MTGKLNRDIGFPMTEEQKEVLAQIAQCAIATAIGCWVYAEMVGDGVDNPKARIAAALIAGVAGSYYITKLYVWLRYGRKAAKSIRWEP